MRTLAIDYGTRRIGLAISDEGGRFATPLDVLAVAEPMQAIEPIRQLIRREAVTRVVVGLPLNMDDTLGPAARTAIAFGRSLTAGLDAAPGLVFVDERLSSFDAEQQLIDHKRRGGKLTRQQKKERLDAMAAASFLQAFLDGQLRALPV